MPPNDGASAAARLRPTFIFAENTKPNFSIRTRRLGGQLQARVGHRGFRSVSDENKLIRIVVNFDPIKQSLNWSRCKV
jgi:hypothetical protein